ncbi:Something about silencing protein 10 [Eumeta japonica]|uniref:Something about silencing protein 10 n=1 Tax=Eumeta variegata TaxID=151549 RepID=A0A4C1XZ86_EUMVA|nr:Something about silencing protein 10 [Eumeta japonica]
MADNIRIDSKYGKQGSHEISDSESEYSLEEKQLLDNIRKRKSDESESEEEVYGFSESDTVSDKNELNIADSDVEGQDNSDDDLPNPKAWGKNKRSYYATDYVDKDYGGFGDHEEAALLEEEEAKNIQKRLLEQLGDDDFTLDFFIKNKVDNDDKDTVIRSDLSQLSKRQKLQLIEKESPEFTGLVEDFKTKLTVAKDDLHPVLELVKDGKLPSCPASKFVKTNYDLILNYCTNISFYLLLKSQKISIQNHPVIKRLYQYRQMLNKMEPIYLEVIKPQIDKILHAVSNNIELQIDDVNKQKESKKRKSKINIESSSKKLKLISSLERNDDDDTGVSDNEDEYEGNEFYKNESTHRNNEESEESGFSDSVEDNVKEEPDIEYEENKPSTSMQDVPLELLDKREITYQIAKNKGLTPHRKKEQRNPRVKHKLKFRKAKIRRKGAELLKHDEEESESELSDQGSETSDHIIAEELLSAEESNCSDSEEDDLPLSEINSCFTGRDKYMNSKPDKYGIKLYPLVDAATFYILNIELYAGKQPEDPYQLSNAALDIAKRLITPISGTGRNLTTDNWYTSVPLTNNLAKNYKVSVVGTIRKNKKEIPPCLIDKKKT